MEFSSTMGGGDGSHESPDNYQKSITPQLSNYPPPPLPRPQLPAPPSHPPPPQSGSTGCSLLNKSYFSSRELDPNSQMLHNKYNSSAAQAMGCVPYDGDPIAAQHHRIGFNDPALPQPLPPPHLCKPRALAVNAEYHSPVSKTLLSPTISPVQTLQVTELPPLTGSVRSVTEDPTVSPSQQSSILTNYQQHHSSSWQAHSPLPQVISPLSPKQEPYQHPIGAEAVMPPVSMIMSQQGEAYPYSDDHGSASNVLGSSHPIGSPPEQRWEAQGHIGLPNLRNDVSIGIDNGSSSVIDSQQTLYRDHLAAGAVDYPGGAQFPPASCGTFHGGAGERRHCWTGVLTSQPSQTVATLQQTPSNQGIHGLQQGKAYELHRVPREHPNGARAYYTPQGTIPSQPDQSASIDARIAKFGPGTHEQHSVPAYRNEGNMVTQESQTKRRRNGAGSTGPSKPKTPPKFQCPTCGKWFGLKGNMKQHVLTVHEGHRPHACDRCTMTFSTRFGRKQHILTVHEGQRPYSCQVCGATFGQRSHLRRHYRVVHKMDEPSNSPPGVQNNNTGEAQTRTQISGAETAATQSQNQVQIPMNIPMQPPNQHLVQTQMHIPVQMQMQPPVQRAIQSSMQAPTQMPSGHDGLH